MFNNFDNSAKYYQYDETICIKNYLTMETRNHSQKRGVFPKGQKSR